MKDKLLFLEKLNGLVKKAQEQNNQITIEEVKMYFADGALTEEQIELVFDYLLSQKVVVKGYLKMETPEEKVFSEEEKAYIREYEADLNAFKHVTVEERHSLFEKVLMGDEMAKSRLVEAYLPEVVKLAKMYHRPEVFLGDLVQEGNLGLVLGMESLVDTTTAHEVITTAIKQSMQVLLEEATDLSSRDKKVLEKVQNMDDTIKNLTEEMGRKISIDELAVHMGIEIEEIEDILKLMGEEVESEQDEE